MAGASCGFYLHEGASLQLTNFGVRGASKFLVVQKSSQWSSPSSVVQSVYMYSFTAGTIPEYLAATLEVYALTAASRCHV
jgi:hypothetical protein